VFIEIDREAENVWNQFEAAYKIEDLFERKAEMVRIKRNFYNYIISVPEKVAPGNNFGNTAIKYINKEQIETTYDKCTGFIRSVPEQYIF
jgi:CRISPR-associated endonuclease/helicase Cas3